jgi:hypothetical protein
MEKYAPDILDAMQRGMEMPKEQWPRVEKPKRYPRDPELEERVKRLKTARDKMATRARPAPRHHRGQPNADGHCTRQAARRSGACPSARSSPLSGAGVRTGVVGGAIVII